MIWRKQLKEISQKIKINPNNKQKTYLLKCFGCKRLAYNWGVEQYNKNLEKGIFKTGYDLKKEFNSIKKIKFPFVVNVNNKMQKNANLKCRFNYLNYPHKYFYLSTYKSSLLS